VTDVPSDVTGREPAGPRGRAGSFPPEAAEMANEPFETGAARPPHEPTEVETPEDGGDAVAALQQQLADRTGDLQRVQAEFLNYKRRVDRDRDLIRENATYAVLAPITEVLDTIDRAREHAELEGGLKTVADQLERIVAGFGLTKFGAVGDPFDPTIHEALSHIGEDPDVTVTTCKVIAKAGYKIGNRVVRAAQVLVVDPAGGPVELEPESEPADDDHDNDVDHDQNHDNHE
jgi:molecular chaperone GrpE